MYGYPYFKTREKIENWIKVFRSRGFRSSGKRYKSKCPQEYSTVDKERRANLLSRKSWFSVELIASLFLI